MLNLGWGPLGSEWASLAWFLQRYLEKYYSFFFKRVSALTSPLFGFFVFVFYLFFCLYFVYLYFDCVGSSLRHEACGILCSGAAVLGLGCPQACGILAL